MTVQQKYGRRKEAERFGKELQVGFFTVCLICNLANVALENSLRARLVINPGHLDFPTIARRVAVSFVVIGRFLK